MTAATAYNRALDALGRRSRSASELRRWLIERKYEPEEVDGVLVRLASAGLLDDAKYAEAFARSRLIDRRLSKRRVLAELARRGVARDVADAAVEQVADDEGLDDVAAARDAAARKWRSLQKLDREVAVRRLYGFLSRKGFGGDAVRSAVKSVAAD